MKSRQLFLTLILVLICVNPLFARDLPTDASPLRVLKAALHLTEDQVTELRGFLEVRAAAIDATTDQIHLLQAQLEEILKSDAPDPLEVGELVLETRVLRGEIGQHHEEFRAAFGDLLTPEQEERIGHINRIALANRAAEVLSQLRLR